MKKKYDEAPSWKKKKPDDINEPHIEGGRTYYWCTKHQMYTMHKAADCKLPKCNNFYRENSSQKGEYGDNLEGKQQENDKQGEEGRRKQVTIKWTTKQCQYKPRVRGLLTTATSSTVFVLLVCVYNQQPNVR
jgi:hypothetical protein